MSDDYLIACLTADRAELQRQLAETREALVWLTNIYSGISKNGGRPDEGEWIDGIEAAKAVIAKGNP